MRADVTGQAQSTAQSVLSGIYRVSLTSFAASIAYGHPATESIRYILYSIIQVSM